MTRAFATSILTLLLLAASAPSTDAAEPPSRAWSFPEDPSRLSLEDVFELEWASDPQVSPDGERIVYVRNSFDRWTDRRRGALWLLEEIDGDPTHRPLLAPADGGSVGSPRWSPDGSRILFTRSTGTGTQLGLLFLESGATTTLTQLTEGPEAIAWSPDGRSIALTSFVEEKDGKLVKLPEPPEGAEWAPQPTLIEDVVYRADGEGYLEEGATQLFVLSAEGGTPRRLTPGPYEVEGEPVWTPDGGAIVFTSNRREDWRYDPDESDLYRVDLESGEIVALTDRDGPDAEPAISPDGRWLAWTGYEDREQGYQIEQLSVRPLGGGDTKVLTAGLDRAVADPVWARDGKGLFFSFSDEGNGKIGYATLDGEVRTVADDVGGTTLGRPYASGSFSVGPGGVVAFTRTRPEHPADVALARLGGEGEERALTRLNQDLLGHKELGEVEEIWFESSFDGRRIQGWVIRPPGFEEGRKYPLVLEIHGGPFADYGDRFTSELQLYATAGYVVLYVNPRGSTSYGEEFGNLIHDAYPSQDYDDLMSGVDAVIERGFVDPENLFVTGGSGGGVLSAWIVGHTDRFRAAVVAKPVVNWTSFVFTADIGPFFWKHFFPGLPWETPEAYFEHSPLSYAGNVTTPTMLLTGEEDYRTPMSESEQFYQALKLQKVDAALVRIPGASHGIARRPSHLMAKVAYVLGWFEKYRD